MSFATDCLHGESFLAHLHPSQPWLVPDDSACAQSPECASHICLPTGLQSARGFQVCCMWDTHLLMGVNTTTLKNTSLALPIVFVTVGQGENLTRILTPSIHGTLFQRPVPLVEVASIVLWALGIATAIGGAYNAASMDRQAMLASKPHAHADDDHHHEHDASDDVLDVSFRHAVGFILFAGVFLTFLYFVHVGPLLSILFGLSTLSTFTMLVTQPIFRTLLCCLRRRYVLRCPSIVGPLPIPDVVATLVTAALVVLWYVDRSTFWFLQDAFGIALCFVFLRTIRLPTLQVASVLLVLAFFYDIFFVFVTPLLFGRSVMVDVATGGQSASSKSGYPGVDFCERYPAFDACVDPEPLPMLLLFPRFHDWRGGQAMLGLGDIVLPGLLLSFALRFDYAREVHVKQTDDGNLIDDNYCMTTGHSWVNSTGVYTAAAAVLCVYSALQIRKASRKHTAHGSRPAPGLRVGVLYLRNPHDDFLHILRNDVLVEMAVAKVDSMLYVFVDDTKDDGSSSSDRLRYLGELYNLLWNAACVANKHDLDIRVVSSVDQSWKEIIARPDLTAAFAYEDMDVAVLNDGRGSSPIAFIPFKDIVDKSVDATTFIYLEDPARQLGKESLVVIGGTFDHLHNGHKKLLSFGAALADNGMLIGVTAPHMLQKKSLGHLIESIQERKSRVEAFLRDVHPHVAPTIITIDDPFGPAITSADISAIVVSTETQVGAVKINAIRADRGLHPLNIYVCRRTDASTLSSSYIREQLAKRPSPR
ncbi:hypothetical protein DYB36_001307 [Aphanomyces astaci]|uniref:Cytidyltransferase-like domain-containing protein n=1 Tax=Aphanomyces astaci TaxID=112090 RepID=A0A396ZR96_APHAT|nr:hypothetical protein DYB36_001307 [Aphanomyces astaci]